MLARGRLLGGSGTGAARWRRGSQSRDRGAKPARERSGTCRGQEARCWNGWKSSGESRSRTRGRTGVLWAAEESLKIISNQSP